MNTLPKFSEIPLSMFSSKIENFLGFKNYCSSLIAKNENLTKQSKIILLTQIALPRNQFNRNNEDTFESLFKTPKG